MAATAFIKAHGAFEHFKANGAKGWPTEQIGHGGEGELIQVAAVPFQIALPAEGIEIAFHTEVAAVFVVDENEATSAVGHNPPFVRAGHELAGEVERSSGTEDFVGPLFGGIIHSCAGEFHIAFQMETALPAAGNFQPSRMLQHALRKFARAELFSQQRLQQLMINKALFLFRRQKIFLNTVRLVSLVLVGF